VEKVPRNSFLFLDEFSLFPSLLFPCSFPVTISGRDPFTPVFMSRCRQSPSISRQIALQISGVHGKFCRRDGFAADCVLRQLVCYLENCSLIPRQAAIRPLQ
jgi:hypothetical protein